MLWDFFDDDATITTMKTTTEKIFLIKALAKHYPDSSQNRCKKWILNGLVSVNNRIVRNPTTLVSSKDNILLGKKKTILECGVEVVYEDSHLVVINKPAGLLSVNSNDPSEPSAHRILKKRKKTQVYPVHRIDKDTSGLLLFVYNEKLREPIKEQFQEHSILRVYEAIIEGNLSQKSGSWKNYITEGSNFTCFITNPDKGKKAVTHFRVLKESTTLSSMEFTLETGRKNQIRVQASHNGHPIVGDKKYGHTNAPSTRLFLHAKTLGFFHPYLQKQMIFKSKAPWRFSEKTISM